MTGIGSTRTEFLPFGIFDYIVKHKSLEYNTRHSIALFRVDNLIHESLSLRSSVIFLIPFLGYAFYPLRYRGEEYLKKEIIIV
jgi:hypothetical protein